MPVDRFQGNLWTGFQYPHLHNENSSFGREVASRQNLVATCCGVGSSILVGASCIRSILVYYGFMNRDSNNSLEATDLELEKIESEEEDLYEDTATYRINTYGADFTLEILSQKLENDEIKIPPFQRRYVWPEKKASRLIESCLLGLPIPQVFLYRQADTQDLLVVDGQQRLKSVHYFFKGKFENGRPFILRAVKDQWEGKTFSTLSEPDKRKFKNFILRATIFEQTDPADNSSVFEIFERLNTGGMALTQQEIRNCVIRGTIQSTLESINKLASWRKLLGKETPDTRMKDIEMILRFLALHKGWREYKKPMKDFITTFMKEHSNPTEKQRAEYERTFTRVMDCLDRGIGRDAFRIKSGINIALFDAVTVALATMGTEKARGLRAKHRKLKNNEIFLDSIRKSTTDPERVQTRIKLAITAFSE